MPGPLPRPTGWRALACRTGLVLCLATAAPTAFAQAADGGNAHTLRVTDLPADAPTFAQFPAGPAYAGKPAAPRVDADPLSRQFRTRLREGARRGADFAGHYTLVTWGCGAGCLSVAIVDARNGQVFHPPELSTLDSSNVLPDGLEAPDGSLIHRRLDSRLLVVIGAINEDPAQRGISYFTWDGAHLTRIRFVAKPDD